MNKLKRLANHMQMMRDKKKKRMNYYNAPEGSMRKKIEKRKLLKKGLIR